MKQNPVTLVNRNSRSSRFLRPSPAAPRRRRSRGFALVVTLSLMVLLALLAVGLLSLSSVALRGSSQEMAMAEARANARLAMMLAIGELQKELGPDQRITAPSAILDSDPQSPSLEGVTQGHLTGVWSARNDALGTTPDYSRAPSFRRWLVSNADIGQTASLGFAANGSLTDPIDIAPGSPQDAQAISAGRVSVGRGRFAWWVADENTKALANPRDDLDRNASAPVSKLLAGFSSPGAHGITALDGLADFPANTAASDKAITRDTLGLVHPQATGARYFHDLSPYPKSVLASVTRGGLRQDLSLYLERSDINWRTPWGKEGANGLPAGPLGPNGLLALGDPREYDTLPWKTLHHWAYAHRQQMGDTPDLPMKAMLRTTPAPDPVSNPAWNSGNTRLFPVVARIQALISFNARLRTGTTNTYDLYLYSFPVVTLWNPYNVPLKVDAMHAWIAKLPLENTVFKNSVKEDLGNNPDLGTRNGSYVWTWQHGLMSMNMIGDLNPAITMAPGEVKLFSYTGPWDPTLPKPQIRHRLNEVPPAWLPTLPGRERPIGTITANPTDRISVGSALATWENSNGLLGDGDYQTTFEFRTDAKGNELVPFMVRGLKQGVPSQICWRHENSNPRPDTISQWNLPNSTLADLVNNPQPFLLLDARLKTLDETKLPNKTWLHNIPSVPLVAATSTAKHFAKGVDAATTFFAHPYTVTYEQVNNIEGIFQNRPFMGSSNRPGGQDRIVALPFPLAPLTSLAQLQNFPLLPTDVLNWSGYYFQNLAIGNSFASPGLQPDQVRRESFPFWSGYFPSFNGDIKGQLYTEVRWFNNSDYTLSHSPARIVDRSYIANQLLFDDYFFSSMAAQKGPVFLKYGAERDVRSVVSEFYKGTAPLPVAAYRSYQPPGNSAATAIDLLTTTSGVTTNAFLKSAARLIVEGGFNINSTSVEAWTAVLSAAKRKRPVTMPGGTSLRAEERGEHVISRNPNPLLADDSDDSRWLGYRELTDAQIRELAVAVVRQVKKRGPFRSLGEFVNRRLTYVTSDEQMALYGAIQAALEDPSVSINANYRGGNKEIRAMDIAGTNYNFPAAALGSRYQGTPAYINQADILTPIAPVIQARSDTFVVRGYGEARSPDGTRILARAWCEAVVQRVPDYLDAAADPTETPYANLQSPVNRRFGRRFHITSFRWLPGGEM
jgi:hypothetical protein